MPARKIFVPDRVREVVGLQLLQAIENVFQVEPQLRDPTLNSPTAVLNVAGFGQPADCVE